MRKKIKKFLVFSVFCPDTQGYPYQPFIDETMYGGISQYIKFLSDRDKVCPNPKLHLIGHITDRNGVLDEIQPLFAPQEVCLSENFLSYVLVMLTHLSLQLSKYFKKIGVFK